MLFQKFCPSAFCLPVVSSLPYLSFCQPYLLSDSQQRSKKSHVYSSFSAFIMLSHNLNFSSFSLHMKTYRPGKRTVPNIPYFFPVFHTILKTTVYMWTAVAQWLMCCATNRKVAGRCQWIFH